MISWYDAVLDKAKEKAWVAMAAENNQTDEKVTGTCLCGPPCRQ